jgi:hypothetical protein
MYNVKAGMSIELVISNKSIDNIKQWWQYYYKSIAIPLSENRGISSILCKLFEPYKNKARKGPYETRLVFER